MPVFARRSCAWLCSVALVAGCSGTYTVTSNDAGLVDASAPVDASQDGLFPTEAAIDANADTGPTRVTPCSSPHVFCDDFDDAGLDLSMRWDDWENTAGTLVRSSASVSAPYALGVDVGTVPKDGDTSITKVVALPVGNVRIEFELRFTPSTTFAANGVIVPFIVQPFPAAQGAQFQQFTVAIAPTGASLDYFSTLLDGGSAYRSTPLAFRENGFQHVTMTITTANGQVTSTASVGSNGPVSISYAGGRPTQLKLSVGVPYARAVTGGAVAIDNVVVDSL